MKKKFIVKLSAILFLGLVALAGCDSKGNTAAHQEKKAQQYTCPMHPQVIKDAPGKCPICGMDLVPLQTATHSAAADSSLSSLLKPVNEQVVASIPTINPESGTRIHSMEVQGAIAYDTRRRSSIASRVSGRIERMNIKYNYQPVKKGQLILEIYSPDLAAAQRELVFIAQRGSNADLLQKAKQRLLLLGMQPAQIQQVLTTGKILYRVPVYSPVNGYILETAAAASAAAPASPSSGGGGAMSSMGGGDAMGNSAASGTSGASQTPQAAAVLLREGQYVNAGQSLFSVYSNTALVAEFSFDPSLAAHIQKGQKLVFRKSADPQTVFTGMIGLIQPTFRPGGNFTIARVYLNDARFQVGQLITANIPIVSRGWWVPQQAVLQLGSQSVVFKKEGDVFVPKTVQVKMVIQGMAQIEDSIGKWEIAKNASYLVDSESFIEFNSITQTEEP